MADSKLSRVLVLGSKNSVAIILPRSMSEPALAKGSIMSAVSRMWSISGRARSRIETMSLPAKLSCNAEQRCEGRVYNFLLQRGVMPERPRTLVAVTSDLFLQSRTNELAASLGVVAHFTTDTAGLKKEVTRETVLVILDLSETDYDPLALARDVKENWPSLRILGFFPHVRADLKARGERAGVDVIVPNSKLIETLGKLLAREVQQAD
jgi:hypothetical protein